MKFQVSYSPLIVTLIVFLSTFAEGADELRLTQTQKQKLDKLKDGIKGLDFPEPWMKADINLLRYLRARVWDVARARDMILQSIKWRKEQKMDKIHQEDWSDFEKSNPIHTDSVDKEGQPLMVFNLGDWDLRAIAIQGKMDKLVRWLFKKREEAVKKSVKNWKSGKVNATQWNFIMNTDKFSPRTHLCAQCLRMYTEFTATYENHYPGSCDKIILINAPSSFEVVMNLIKPLFSEPTAKAFTLLGSSKAQWEPVVYKQIERDQLPREFGGTKKYNSID